MKTVRPKVRCRVRTSSSKSPAPIGSRPEVGSSRNTSSGSSASARASATRLIMPPESSEGKRSATSGRNPTMPSFATVISSSNRWLTLRYSRTGNWMFCRTVSEENSAPCWNRMPQRRSTPRRARASAASRSMPKTSMLPLVLGTSPMMVRVSTDLPAPDGPTKPRISPRWTSRSRPSSTLVDPNCTEISRTRMMASAISGAMSHSDRGEKDRKYAVHDDDEENPLHHRRGGVLSKRFGTALHREPLDAGNDADHRRHHRRLDDADGEMIDRDGVAQPQQEGLGIDAAIEPRHQPAAIQCRDGAEKGEDRQRDDQRQHPGQDQNLDRIESHGAQGVDFLAHFHRTELGGVGAAGSTRHHDRHQQHADFAQHQHAQHVDHEDIGAEFAEMKDALLGDDAADQKGDQHHDRHRAPADLLEMMHGRGQAEARGMYQNPGARRQHRAKHVDQANHGRADADHGAADLIQYSGDRDRIRVDGGRRLHPTHLVDQAGIIGGESGDLGLIIALGEAAAQPLDQ